MKTQEDQCCRVCIEGIKAARTTTNGVLDSRNGEYYGRGDQVLSGAAQQRSFFEEKMAKCVNATECQALLEASA